MSTDNKQTKMSKFNPNDGTFSGVYEDGNIFNLPFNYEEAETVILPVPWEATVSYGSGTAEAADYLIEASKQLDLYDPYYPRAWRQGLYMLDSNKELLTRGETTRAMVQEYCDKLSEGAADNNLLSRINDNCTEMVAWVFANCQQLLKDNKRIALFGGSHSTPLGLIQALAKTYKEFGILQIDAHFDLRDSFQGFEYSHASIMRNALKEASVSKLVAVGIRDYCQEEVDFLQTEKRVAPFYDRDIKRRKFAGESWHTISQEIVSQLPQHVYISFDIDGLNQQYCPNTGTPVPGGLDFEEALYLIEGIVDAGKKIIGLDLVETAPGQDSEWDMNVAARILYRACNAMAKSWES